MICSVALQMQSLCASFYRVKADSPNSATLMSNNAKTPYLLGRLLETSFPPREQDIDKDPTPL